MSKESKSEREEPETEREPAAGTPVRAGGLHGLAEPSPTLWVQGVADEDGTERVSLWETHPAHPGGEVFVAPGLTVEVGRTATVAGALASGLLEEVAAP